MRLCCIFEARGGSVWMSWSMLASVLKRKCGSICACSASIRASSRVRSSCSVSARLMASLAVKFRASLAPRHDLDDEGGDDEKNVRVGSFNMPPPRIMASNKTSSSAFQETTATQSKKAHHITTMPLRISRKAWPMPMGRAAGSLVARSAASVTGFCWLLLILLLLMPDCRRQDYGRVSSGSSATGHNA